MRSILESGLVGELSPPESSSPLGLLGRLLSTAPTRIDDFSRAILGALPAAVYTTDAAGRITYFNEAAAELWGQSPELGSSQWCGSWKLYWPDGRPLPHDQCPMAIALKESRPIRGIEAVAERPDGSRVQFRAFPTPLLDKAGTLIGAVNMLIDVTDRNLAAEDAERLAAIVASSDDAILSKDLNTIITSWNTGAERLFGYTAAEMIGKSVTILIPEDRLNEEPEILARIRRGERVDHYETVRRRKDGSLIDISLTVSPLRNAGGEIVGASKIARDITELRRAHEQQKLLLNEMKHRVRNTLTTVQAIASQTLRSATDSDRAAFLARLRALASAHDLLTLERWNRAPVDDVVSGALAAFQGSYGVRLRIAGSGNISLDAHRSMLLAMTLHELATNAIKHGALSNETGHVDVTWERITDPPAMRFAWRECGGPPVEPPTRKGFGSVLIERALVREVRRVTYEFDPRGVSCVLELPLGHQD
jgi:PAS domain S-box-containing protein